MCAGVLFELEVYRRERFRNERSRVVGKQNKKKA